MPVWPSSPATSHPPPMSQTRTVLSPDPETIFEPSGLHAQPNTPAVCPLSSFSSAHAAVPAIPRGCPQSAGCVTQVTSRSSVPRGVSTQIAPTPRPAPGGCALLLWEASTRRATTLSRHNPGADGAIRPVAGPTDCRWSTITRRLSPRAKSSCPRSNRSQPHRCTNGLCACRSRFICQCCGGSSLQSSSYSVVGSILLYVRYVTLPYHRYYLFRYDGTRRAASASNHPPARCAPPWTPRLSVSGHVMLLPLLLLLPHVTPLVSYYFVRSRRAGIRSCVDAAAAASCTSLSLSSVRSRPVIAI